MRKRQQEENQLEFESWETEKLITRAMFADWYYIHAKELVTTKQGEACWRAFLKGDTIIIRE
jgi:hypothetical protein